MARTAGKNNWFLRFQWITAFVFCTPVLIFSQADSSDIYDLDFSQLSKMKIVSTSKVVRNSNEVPATVHVISSTEIHENGYSTLEEALSSLPGFQFRNIQGINSYVFQRGVPNQNNLTLLLIDGIQINELNSGGFYAGSQYNLANVDRIEVVYGPASVVYGTNAVTGIINIITKPASHNQYGLQQSLGSFGTVSGNFTAGYFNEEKNTGLRVAGMYAKTNRSDLKLQAGDNNWTDRMDNFEKDFAFDVKLQSGNFTVGTNFLQKQTTTATLWKSVGTGYKDYGTLWNIRFINAFVKYSKPVSEQLSFSSVLYNRNATLLDNTIYQVFDTAQVGYFRPNNLTGIEGILNYDFSSSASVTAGATMEYESLAKSYAIEYSHSQFEKPPAPGKPAMLNNYLTSLFVEPRLSLYQDLYLTGGLRFDYSSTYNEVFTPRFGLSYNFSDCIFRFSYAEAFRAPKPWDYSDGLGNTSLKPERMKSFEASITFPVKNNLTVDFTGYNNTIKNAFVKEINVNGYRWVNSGAVTTGGIELNLRHTFKNIKSTVNYTYTESYDEFQKSLPEIARHTANLSITYLLYNHFVINLRANYSGQRENPKTIVSVNDRYVKPCLVFHSALSIINYNGFDVQFLIKNVFDTEYYHTSNRDPDRYRQPQRQLIFSAGYSFDN